MPNQQPSTARRRAPELDGEILRERMTLEVPIHIERGEDGEPVSMNFEGIASTDHVDLKNTIIAHGGVSWDYWKKYGWFNDIHLKSAGAKVGVPRGPSPVESVKLPDGHLAWKVKGKLLSNTAGKNIWETLVAIENDGVDRDLALSIQGPVIKRSEDGKVIAQMVVTDIAITGHPLNKHCTMKAVYRSLDTIQRSLEAGYNVAEYDAGETGSGSALVPQSMVPQTARRVIRGRKKEKGMDEKLRELFEGMSPDEQREALRSQGIELEGDDEVERSFDNADAEIAAALADVREHLERGLPVILDDGQEESDGGAFDAGLIANQTESIRAMGAGHEALARGIAAVLQGQKALGEVMRSLEGRQEAIEGFFRGRGAALPRRSAVAGDGRVLARQDGSTGERRGGDVEASLVDYATVQRSLEAAVAEAERTNDKARVQRLERMQMQAEANGIFTRGMLAREKVEILPAL